MHMKIRINLSRRGWGNRAVGGELLCIPQRVHEAFWDCTEFAGWYAGRLLVPHVLTPSTGNDEMRAASASLFVRPSAAAS